MARNKKLSRKLTSSLSRRNAKRNKKHHRDVLAMKWKCRRGRNLHVSDSSEKLIAELKAIDNFETLERDVQRSDIIRQLDDLIQKWVKDVAEIRGMCEFQAQKLSGKLYTYGSYRLGVHHQNTEMDTIVFVPHIIQANDFYNLFYQLLRTQPEISECRLFSKYKFSSIRMKYNGFGVNMTMARLPFEKIPENFNPNNIRLEFLDEYSLCSIHGLQMTNAIIDLVPNFKTFTVSLRAIRVWAYNCNMYSHVYGFLRGGALTVLVAHVCRMYPKAVPSKIVRKFFICYAYWDWNIPVILKEVKDRKLDVPMWDRIRDEEGRPELMSVITPVYPQQNLTKDVGTHSQYMIVEEFHAAIETTKFIKKGILTWSHLFTTSAFHNRWTHFLTIQTTAPTLEAHNVWSELVQSNINFFYKAWITCDFNTLCVLNRVAQPCTDSSYSSKWLISIEVINENAGVFGHLPTVLDYFQAHLAKLACKRGIFDRRVSIYAYFEPRCQLCETYNYEGNLIYGCDCLDARFIFALRTQEELLDDKIHTQGMLYMHGTDSDNDEMEEVEYIC